LDARFGEGVKLCMELCSRLTIAEFEKVKIAENHRAREGKSCRPFHSPLWQADSDKIRRMAPN
jgi:hypothetical protein